MTEANGDIFGAEALALAEAHDLDVYDSRDQHHKPEPITVAEAWGLERHQPGRTYVLLDDAARSISYFGRACDVRQACISAAEKLMSCEEASA